MVRRVTWRCRNPLISVVPNLRLGIGTWNEQGKHTLELFRYVGEELSIWTSFSFYILSLEHNLDGEVRFRSCNRLFDLSSECNCLPVGFFLRSRAGDALRIWENAIPNVQFCRAVGEYSGCSWDRLEMVKGINICLQLPYGQPFLACQYEQPVVRKLQRSCREHRIHSAFSSCGILNPYSMTSNLNHFLSL